MRHQRQRNRVSGVVRTGMLEQAHGVLTQPVVGMEPDPDLLDALLERIDAIDSRLEALEEREEVLSDEVSSLSAQVGDIKTEVEDFQQY